MKFPNTILAELASMPVQPDSTFSHDAFREIFNMDARAGIVMITANCDGMEPTIHSGDTLFIDTVAPIVHYGIVVAQVQGLELLQVRRYTPAAKGYVLTADNGAHRNFRQCQDVRIVGVVRAIVTRRSQITRRPYYAN